MVNERTSKSWLGAVNTTSFTDTSSRRQHNIVRYTPTHHCKWELWTLHVERMQLQNWSQQMWNQHLDPEINLNQELRIQQNEKNACHCGEQNYPVDSKCLLNSACALTTKTWSLQTHSQQKHVSACTRDKKTFACTPTQHKYPRQKTDLHVCAPSQPENLSNAQEAIKFQECGLEILGNSCVVTDIDASVFAWFRHMLKLQCIR